MFRTVSEIRAHRGQCFIVTNTPASTNDAFARSKRRQEALVANAKDFSDFLGRPVDLLEEHCEECIWYPFFPVASRGNPASGRAPLTPAAIATPALVRSSRGQARRRPSPRRAPPPRRRVRRGCAEPAPPAGPSGAAGSGQPLGTLRSPPRPRGGANRAGERGPPPLPQYNSQRGGSGSTEIWPLTNFWPGSMCIGPRWSLIPSYNRQNALVFYGLP